MITKIGKAILTRNSAEMDELNKGLGWLALELQNISPEDFSEYKNIMSKFKKNRELHTELQEEITNLVRLESFLSQD